MELSLSTHFRKKSITGQLAQDSSVLEQHNGGAEHK